MSSLWATQDSCTADSPWSDDVAASAPDWHLSSKEAILKQSLLWNPWEDAWLRDKQPLFASDCAYKSMDLHVQRNHHTELRELCGIAPASGADLVTDRKGLRAWVAKSMPHMPWPSLTDSRDLHYRAFFSHYHPHVPPQSPHVPSRSQP